ncbi:MAG: DNA repair protein RecO [Spirochaetes bacterium]|nr:DNA repair protein RecO [Spirochaetota bacterium]
MEIRKTQAIVLTSRPFGEADRLACAYTREYGKNLFLFKGIRKTKKRALAATEPGTLLHMVYYSHEDRDFSIANEFHIQKQCFKVRSDLEKMTFLFFILELVDKTTATANPVPRIFELLKAALDILETTEIVAHLVVFFTLHLLRTEGLISHNYSCKKCGDHNVSRFSIDPSDFAIVCEKCTSQSKFIEMMNANVLDFLKNAMRQKFSSMNLNSVSKGEMLNVLFILTLFVEKYFNVELKSKLIVFSHQLSQ